MTILSGKECEEIMNGIKRTPVRSEQYKKDREVWIQTAREVLNSTEDEAEAIYAANRVIGLDLED